MNHLSAQQDCYYRFLQEGIEAYRNFDFEAARKKFSAAKICPDIPNNDDLDIWFERLRSGYQEVLKEFKEETDSILLVLDSLRTKSRAIENQIAISDSEMFLNNAKNKDLPEGKANIQDNPLAIGLTDFHYYLLFQDGITIMSTITKKIVQF